MVDLTWHVVIRQGSLCWILHSVQYTSFQALLARFAHFAPTDSQKAVDIDTLYLKALIVKVWTGGFLFDRPLQQVCHLLISRKFHAIQQIADDMARHGGVTRECISDYLLGVLEVLEIQDEILDFAKCSRQGAQDILELMEASKTSAQNKLNHSYDMCASLFQESYRIMALAYRMTHCHIGEQPGFHTAAEEIIWRSHRVEALLKRS